MNITIQPNQYQLPPKPLNLPNIPSLNWGDWVYLGIGNKFHYLSDTLNNGNPFYAIALSLDFANHDYSNLPLSEIAPRLLIGSNEKNHYFVPSYSPILKLNQFYFKPETAETETIPKTAKTNTNKLLSPSEINFLTSLPSLTATIQNPLSNLPIPNPQSNLSPSDNIKHSLSSIIAKLKASPHYSSTTNQSLITITQNLETLLTSIDNYSIRHIDLDL